MKCWCHWMTYQCRYYPGLPKQYCYSLDGLGNLVSYIAYTIHAKWGLHLASMKFGSLEFSWVFLKPVLCHLYVVLREELNYFASANAHHVKTWWLWRNSLQDLSVVVLVNSNRTSQHHDRSTTSFCNTLLTS